MLPPQNRLYAITDRNLAGLPNDQIVAQLLLGGAKLIQLRDKQASARELLESARACRKLTRAMGATLIINDRVDVALAAEADGVHLGQEDMTPDKAREVLGPAAIIGLSTHSLDQFRAGMKTSANYLALGPIFATTTKENPDEVVGLESLRAAKEISNRPIVAIGGIKEDRVTEVIEAGADYVAIVSALYVNAQTVVPDADGIISRVRAFDILCNSL